MTNTSADKEPTTSKIQKEIVEQQIRSNLSTSEVLRFSPQKIFAEFLGDLVVRKAEKPINDQNE